MSKRQKKRAKFSTPPLQRKTPHIAENVDDLTTRNFKWRMDEAYIDYDHEEWGWGQVGIRQFFQCLLPRLQDYETMTWNEITQRVSCHAMEVSRICPAAKRRLQEMNLDIDTLHQIDMRQPCRLWGYRDKQILYIIWHDPNHSVYPLKK